MHSNAEAQILKPAVSCLLLADSITGYVVDVSTVKVAKSSGKPYFWLEIQTADKIDSALCFSPSKRKLFNELCSERRGCSINNVKAGNHTFYVNDYSTVEEKDLGFVYSTDIDYLTVEQVINQVALDTKVNVRGVVLLQPIHSVRVGDDEDVSIRDGHLVAENASIKLTLWREYCELFEHETTYDFKNLLKMKYSGEIRLQSLYNYHIC